MKNITILLIALLFGNSLIAQNKATYYIQLSDNFIYSTQQNDKNRVKLTSNITSIDTILNNSNIEEYQYVPIPKNHIWSVNTDKFKTHGDTLINSKEYIKVYIQWKDAPFEFDMNTAHYYCALRNDTLNKRVYVVYPSFYPHRVYDYSEDVFLYMAADTTEFLLYDFSLNAGDTISIYEYSDDCIYKVKMQRVEKVELFENLTYLDVDSLQILENGDFRKRILLEIYNPYGWFGIVEDKATAWTEGIGSIHGLTRHFFAELKAADLPCWNLLCYANEEELLWSTPWNINNNCYRFIPSGGINENKNEMDYDIYPNPAADFIHIKNIQELGLNDCWIEIIDLLGKSVLQQNYENQINISQLKAGYYFVKIVAPHKNLNTKGFVKL